MLVWEKLWPVLYEQVFSLFLESLQQGKLSQKWKLAKIIPFKKAGKANLTKARAFCSINLLSMLSKAIEAIVAKKIAYLAEKFNFFTSNYYKALKQKFTIDALLIIQKKIYQA